MAVASELVASHSGGQLSCLAQITDPNLCVLLRIQETKHTDSASALDFFNTDEISARLMLNEFPIDSEHGPPHILVAHLDDLGGWLIWHAARDWYDSRRDDSSPLQVTVLDDRGDQQVRALLAQHPDLEKGMSIHQPHDFGPRHPAATGPSCRRGSPATNPRLRQCIPRRARA